jgi:hypothetical protein
VTEHDDELVYNPTPQDWGFPEKPTLQQRNCWENQERFLKEYARRGKLYQSAAAVGLTCWCIHRWESADLYSFNKRLQAAHQEYRESLEQSNEDWVEESKHNTQIMRIFMTKAAWPEKYGDHVQITADAPAKQMFEQMRQLALQQQRALEQGASEAEYRELGEEDQG